jgi:hypothetical protein
MGRKVDPGPGDPILPILPAIKVKPISPGKAPDFRPLTPIFVDFFTASV